MVLLSVAVSFLLRQTLSCKLQNAPDAATPESLVATVPPLEVAPPPREVAELEPIIQGVVVEVSKTSISLQGFSAYLHAKGVTSIQMDERNASVAIGNPLTMTVNGRTITGIRPVSTHEALTITSASGAVTTFRRIDQPIRRFEPSEELAAGEIPVFTNGLPIIPWHTYRLADVRVGDVVRIECWREDGVNICESICIVRRPGGRIPPAPGEPANQKIKHHEKMQAAQDLEAKGIPIPDRFLTPWELASRRAKIAPMPREVVPRIPTKMP